jgi:hypothetical protein
VELLYSLYQIEREEFHFIWCRRRLLQMRQIQKTKNVTDLSGIGLDGGNLATLGRSWRECVPAIVETDIFEIN